MLLALSFGVVFGTASAQKPTARAGAAAAEFERLAKQAAAASQANRVPEAIELYQKALKFKPRWQEGWWSLGTLYYDSDRYAEAVPAFRNLVQLNPKMGPAWALLGLCEFETGDRKNALIHLQRGRVLGLGGNQELSNVTLYHQTLLLNLSGEFEAATELLSALVARGVLSEDVKVAFGLAELRVPLLPNQLDPSKDALVHAAGEAAILVAQSNFDQADLAFQQLLKDFPSTPFLHYAYGSALVMLSRYEDAEKEFREEMKITPESAFPFMQLAFLKLRTKRYDEALPVANAAVRLAPNAFLGHYLLGRTLVELGDVLGAIKELETARRLGPYSPEVRYNLARAYARADRKDEAARERKEFARLSALLERKQQESGPQSYRSSSDRGAPEPREVKEAAPPPK